MLYYFTLANAGQFYSSREIYLFIYLFIYIFIYLSIYLVIYLFIYLFIYELGALIII